MARPISRQDSAAAILSVRVDESLYFANARYLEYQIYDMVAGNPDLKHAILVCPAVNTIDMSALDSLEAINERLKAMDIALHLSELKGPVMDRLSRTDFLDHLSDEVFLSQYEAVSKLGGKLERSQR